MITENDRLHLAVQREIDRLQLLSPGERVLVALSGGADSTALLLILLALGFDVRAAHINHQLRGEESERDEQFVRALCERLSLPLSVFRVDVREHAEAQHCGIEQAARELRYECLQRAAGGDKIATAHNLNDDAETLIFNITRGCGVAGLRSIPASRDNIIRPLLRCSREQLEQYLERCDQPFVTDSTNLSDDYTRNLIRHRVLPQLCEINPDFLHAAARLCDNADAAARFIASAVDALGEQPELSALQSLDDAPLCEYLTRLCKKQGCSPQHSQLKTALAVIRRGQGAAQLSGGSLYIDGGALHFGAAPSDEYPPFCVDFSPEGVITPYCSYRVQRLCAADIATENIKKIHSLFYNNAIDCDKMGKNIVMRSRRAGDSIKLRGRPTKTLKALHNEQRLSRHSRAARALLCDEQGVIWAEGFGVAQRCAPDEYSTNIILITAEN